MIGSFYIRWRKKIFLTFFSAVPMAYFMFKIFTYRHYEPFPVLVYYLIGLFLSAILLIVAIRFLSKKR
ncbi:MAG TPA: hypothetical protein DEQ24_03525 [Enterococcus sp.]|nr:hypothetical protein [Enterococcus sp.]